MSEIQILEEYRKWKWTQIDFKSEFQRDAMQHGHDKEPLAILEARKILDPMFQQLWVKPGICISRTYSLSCSPDSIFFKIKKSNKKVSMRGVEAKCPYTKAIPTEIEELEADNVLQCFFSMYCTEAEAWYLIYYDAWGKERSLFKIKRNDELFQKLYPLITLFLKHFNTQTDFKKEGRRNTLKKNWLHTLRKYDFIKKK